MGKITKNYIYNAMFQLLTLIAPLFVSPFLTRVLGAEQLGMYSFVTSSANVIVTIGLLGTIMVVNKLPVIVMMNVNVAVYIGRFIRSV